MTAGWAGPGSPPRQGSESVSGRSALGEAGITLWEAGVALGQWRTALRECARIRTRQCAVSAWRQSLAALGQVAALGARAGVPPVTLTRRGLPGRSPLRQAVR